MKTTDVFNINQVRDRFARAILLIAGFLILLCNTGNGQSIITEKVTLGLRNESMETAIKRIEQQSIFRFFYRNEDVRPLVHLNLTTATRTITQTLDALLQNSFLSFRQIDQHILLERRDQQGSYEIRGRVLDSADKKAVANASVFLSNATIGCKTADDGTFVLHNVRPGKYDLVVSIIGFGTYNRNVIVTNNNVDSPDIILFPKTIALNEVKVKFKTDPDRGKYYGWFKDEFLGTSDLARECKILNPEVLDLNYDEAKNRLTASSYDFLEIENRALGYKIKYHLTDFSFQTASVDEKNIFYKGDVLFEKLTGTPREENRWKRNRQKVYENSPMHFLRSAVNNRLEEDGFRVQPLVTYTNPEHPSGSPVKKLLPLPLYKKDIIQTTNQAGQFALAYNADGLYVRYSKTHHFHTGDDFKDLNTSGNTENTLVKFNLPRVFFYANGVIANPYSILFYGAWGKNRVAELLPVDYELPTGKIKNGDNTTPKTDEAHDLPSQSNYLQAALLKLKTTSDSINETRTPEKLFLQFDKPNYAVGDTIWFKAYLFHAPTLGLSAKSGIMYIDIANDSSTFIKQYRLPVKDGLSWGSVDLNDFPAGNYTLRAYTSWMRNFGADGFFYKRFILADANEQTWLANSKATSAVVNGKLQASIKLQLSDINKTALSDKALQLEVMAGNHHLYKQQVQTDQQGILNVNFMAPEKAAGLTITALDKQSGNKLIIPIDLNRAKHADVQFLPEGGNLVAGLPAHIGFKAIGEDGRGINISGIITDHNQKQVAAFQSLHTGMGSFDMTVQPGENYTAKVTLPGGAVQEYALPAAKSTGTVLGLINPSNKDSVTVLLAVTKDVIQSGESYFLIGKSRGIICYAAVLSFKAGTVKRNIAKQLFPSGITHFILTNAKGQSLNERLVFIDHHDDLQVAFTTDKPVYAPYDSVAVHITVTDSIGTPIAGNFSMAITDDGQVKQDTMNSENIITCLLLTADLKGYIEEPGYYLQATNTQAWQALDNLLLTQGWVSYDWQADKQHPEFAAEEEFIVKGQVQNVINHGVKTTHVTLLSKSPLFVRDTVTDKDGRFVFRNFPVIDTPRFIIKAVNRHDKSFNVGIIMDDDKPPAFIMPVGPVNRPWYLNSDTSLLNIAKNNRIRIHQEYFATTGHMLEEVKIIARKTVKGSQNLNGPGNADLVLDEKDMIKAGKKTWLDLLQEKIKGFRTGNIKNYLTRFFVQHKAMGDVMNATANSYPGPYFPWYFVEDKPVKFIIDGIPFGSTSRSQDSGVPNITDITEYLQSHDAEDIKGIELNSTLKYSSEYFYRYFPSDWGSFARMYLHTFDFAFIEITTRSGRGPEIRSTPGIYLYKPLALSWPKQYYKPHYTVNDATKRLQDLRSTIDWEPYVSTDKNGKATIWFYTAGNPGTYTLTIEGTDWDGNLGFKMGKIRIGKPGI
ncbi:MAG: carboxypeptidase regulatory-like protein [Mucilaginibacter sp.]|nr:carboxypeptidase regulatory-like protein [Mucilaginibacter sp.]